MSHVTLSQDGTHGHTFRYPTLSVTHVTHVDICPLWVVRNPQSLSLRITTTQVSSHVFIIYYGLYT